MPTTTGYTTIWRDLTDRAAPFVKNIPGTLTISGRSVDVWAGIANMVSDQMYTVYPWKDTIQDVGAAQITLSDGVQDYDVPQNIYRMTKVEIVRTDITPNEWRELDVQDDLDVNLVSYSYQDIKAASLQASVGKIRLESAVAVPSGYALELHCDYQINPMKVTATSDSCWFKDQYNSVAFAGILYYAYKLADDPRAGTATTNFRGQAQYTGQLGEWMTALNKMQQAEDYGPNEQYYPGEPMGAWRDWGVGIPRIFGN